VKRASAPSRDRGSADASLAVQETLRLIEERRDEVVRRRHRQLLFLGVSISLLVHLALMFYFATRVRLFASGPGPQPVTYEFAIMQEEELTELMDSQLDELAPEIADELEQLPDLDATADLDPAVPAADLAISRSGAAPTLGGSGDGEAAGNLTGGGAGTSFFGVSSRGMRFAYIVDRSGSMGDDRKMQIAKRELARSIDNLPDYAFFYVVLFSSDITIPPMQNGWMRARKSTINRFIRWLNLIDPTGGTEPIDAFRQVFSLDVRPDVIFFLTDGQIPDDTARLVANLNRRGERVTINTIAFGDDQSQALLREIAADSGGTYRFVRSDGS
jgi:hypothetical protein